MKYLVFDVETTGLSAKKHRICQVSSLLIEYEGHEDGHRLLQLQNDIVYPLDFTIPAESAAIHGITTQIARRRGRNLREILRDFADNLRESAAIIGHNLKFDMRFLDAAAKKIGISLVWPEKRIDTMWKDGKRHKLGELYRRTCGKTLENAHNSLWDSYATFVCFAGKSVPNIEKWLCVGECHIKDRKFAGDSRDFAAICREIAGDSPMVTYDLAPGIREGICGKTLIISAPIAAKVPALKAAMMRKNDYEVYIILRDRGVFRIIF